jgi:hypothetical protein
MRDLAIRNTHPTVIIINNDKEAWDKEGSIVNLNEDIIAIEIARLQEEYDLLSYKRDREYPPIGEQLDQLYWDKKNGTSIWEEGIDLIKNKYPKV